MRATPPHRYHGFDCPLHSSCLSASEPPYSTFDAANEAVGVYQGTDTAGERRLRAHELYRRHLPLVKRTLARFCPQSRCHPGLCLVEDLVGESYPVFERSLDEYDSSRGLDFLGYASRQLFWKLEHHARALLRALRPPPPELHESVALQGEEDCLLRGVVADEVLQGLSAEDVECLTLQASGHAQREIARAMGVSYAAARKRLERLRRKLKERYE